MNQDISSLRRVFDQQALHESELAKNPFDQFHNWFEEAVANEPFDPNAMTLSTISPENRPASRIVLLKGIDSRGFIFYTNYQSEKGMQLAGNPHASVVFWWGEKQRQVRIDGVVERISPQQSDDYYVSRPRDSQLGAWVSKQSTAIPNREWLSNRCDELTAQYEGKDIPRPPHWGGYRIVPDLFEFWQGQPSRLHDRFRYTIEANGWNIQRLCP
ncbi:pyridoxamine 5'-phosphate oxidase [Oceanospirillum beijerinckii]|uniref:pyridoxamine 5'-phosphate oxidase n=1 Tax=Oceanospirillum beijerinckii TaxID=64976 RepID=UPI00040643B1|nr:pyridoxamine 5'-phosphate oxidase [Oceanospirillum beijerinckii]MAC46499.1 pyridoxamine 5'-phosphate oxidase [Oceanospirillum sp.]